MANKTIATITSSDGKSEAEVQRKPDDPIMRLISFDTSGNGGFDIIKDGKYIGSADTREEAISKAAKAVS